MRVCFVCSSPKISVQNGKPPTLAPADEKTTVANGPTAVDASVHATLLTEVSRKWILLSDR
jgi:hypothetical protein